VREYDRAVVQLNQLVDEVGDSPKDPRYRFIDTLSLLIEAYDEEHYPIPDASPIELLKFLMEQSANERRARSRVFWSIVTRC
jgi:HTH-type transcriptional regulator/antitoxin HigA